MGTVCLPLYTYIKDMLMQQSTSYSVWIFVLCLYLPEIPLQVPLKVRWKGCFHSDIATEVQ